MLIKRNSRKLRRKTLKKDSIKSVALQKTNDRYVEDLIADVKADFKKRQEKRIAYERQWELNINFLNGNQYCDVNAQGELLEENKTFYWQGRGVYNHIAPIIDTRLAKFSYIQPTVSVRPTTDDDKDVESASLTEKLLENAFKKTNFHDVVKKATVWSETCGTSFYKVVWNSCGGNLIGVNEGKQVYEGEVEVLAISPFEIFPDSLSTEKIEDCHSIIHARAMNVVQVKELYGVDIAGQKIDVQSLQKTSSFGDNNHNSIDNGVIVIERYEKPTKQFPNGRLITVAGDKLLFVGELPYRNGENGLRGYPFVKQDSVEQAGCFFGTSVIERLIPVQRAYNAVKNRKHEFLNRLSMGIMTVEDGSMDVDDLAQDGLSPGKVLVYRQGSKAPEIMANMTMPTDFNQEEDKLLNEFVVISGVSNVSSSSANASLSSGTALEILVEQDNSRLLRCAEEIRDSYIKVSKQMIRLYSQFSAGIRAVKTQDQFNKTKILYIGKSSTQSDDVYLDNENELLYTNTQKKDMIFKLYESGLLCDNNGKMRPATKEKVLSLLGYKELDYQKGLARLQEEKAQRENDIMLEKEVAVDEIDDHAIHKDEHIRYVLSEQLSLNEKQKQNFYAHIKAHNDAINKEIGDK